MMDRALLLIEKAHTAKLINNFDVQNIDEFILLAKKFLSALLI